MTSIVSPGNKLIIHDDGNIVIYDKDGKTIWSTGKPFANAYNLKNPNTTVNSQNLSWQNSDDFLLNSTTNDCYAVTDANDSSKYYLLIAQQTDGNMVEYHCSFNSSNWYSPCGSENAIFSMQNNSTTKVTTTSGNVWKFQSDGNLVYYTASGSAIWDTWTVGTQNQTLYNSPEFSVNNSGVSYLVSGNINDTKAIKLILQNDGNLVLYNEQSQALWGSLYPNFLNQGLGFNAKINAWFNEGTCHEQLDSYLVQTPVPACTDAALCSQSNISNFQINAQVKVDQTSVCVAGKMGQL